MCLNRVIIIIIIIIIIINTTTNNTTSSVYYTQSTTKNTQYIKAYNAETDKINITYRCMTIITLTKT